MISAGQPTHPMGHRLRADADRPGGLAQKREELAILD